MPSSISSCGPSRYRSTRRSSRRSSPRCARSSTSSRPRGTVRRHARVFRRPMAGRPEGLIEIHAEIDPSEQCEITWAELPYPIRNLTGRLELHPNLWVFHNVQGRNGEAIITASGEVTKLSDQEATQRRLPAPGSRRAASPEPPVQRGAAEGTPRRLGTGAGRRSIPRAPATSSPPPWTSSPATRIRLTS